VYPILKGRAETMSEKSRFEHRIRALHRRAGLLKTEAEAISITEWISPDLHQLRMERNAILWAIEVLTKNQELAIKHLPPLYSTPTIGPERGEKT
jgi:hypothetical protein